MVFYNTYIFVNVQNIFTVCSIQGFIVSSFWIFSGFYQWMEFVWISYRERSPGGWLCETADRRMLLSIPLNPFMVCAAFCPLDTIYWFELANVTWGTIFYCIYRKIEVNSIILHNLIHLC